LHSDELADLQGVIAPVRTPVEVIERLRVELANIVAKPDVKERLEQFGMEPAGDGHVSSGKWFTAKYNDGAACSVKRISRWIESF
jgi:tripartite-type tricarboxylate transporter receptor subunit TctC